MKKLLKNRKDILILLSLLIAFSCTINVIYSKAAYEAEDKITDADILRAISPQLIAGDIENTAKALSQLPFNQRVSVIRKILEAPGPLDRDAKLNLLFKLVLLSAKNEAQKILDFLSKIPLLQEGSPIIYHAVQHSNEKSIPHFLSWLKNKFTKDKKLAWISTVIPEGLEFMVHRNSPDSLEKIFANGLKVTKPELTKLLWLAVEENKDPQFIPLLVKQGADINAVKNKRTPIIKAAENNNLPLVKALAENGADINALPDNEVGSALQVAVRKGYTPIDLYLRSKGARE